MFAFGVISIEVWETKFPVQWFILALVIAFFYVIPIGMIQAITNQQVGLNVITELIIGYALPGRPVAMMMFKTWGYITMAQGECLNTRLCPSVLILFLSFDLHRRLQAWSLHEDSPSLHVLRPGRRHRHRWNCPPLPNYGVHLHDTMFSKRFPR